MVEVVILKSFPFQQINFSFERLKKKLKMRYLYVSRLDKNETRHIVWSRSNENGTRHSGTPLELTI